MLLIASPTSEELQALLSATPLRGQTTTEMEPQFFATAAGQVVALATGAGLLNATMAIARFFGESATKSPVTAIVYAGLAAGFDLQKTPLRSICVVRQEIWPEYGLNDGNNVVARAFSHPLWKMNDNSDIYDSVDLTELAAIFPSRAQLANDWLPCVSLTVAGVTASFNRREYLWNKYQAQLENTEGFAVAYAGLRLGVPTAEIRVVSHKAGPRSREEKDTAGALAVLKTLLPSLNLS